jgi:hypothetical protein
MAEHGFSADRKNQLCVTTILFAASILRFSCGALKMMARVDRFLTVAALAAMVFIAGIAVQPATAGTTGGIQGYITDTTGKPLAAVQVSVAAPSFVTRTTTGANGFYAVNGLPLDTYKLTFSKTGYQPVTIPGATISQDQALRVNGVMQTETKTLARVTVRGTTSLIQPSQTADTYVVNQTTLSNLNGTPQDPNGFQAFNALPGVTTDNAGYPTIRAGAENDLGYQLDGVDNTDPVTGQFLNAATLNGARSVQISTGGYDVSSGNTNSGVINEVIDRGAYPGSGQATARTMFSTFSHELSFDWGNATPDNKFSYYYSYDGQRDAFEFGDKRTILPVNLALEDFFTTNDSILNLFYRFGKDQSNEVQFLSNLSGQTLGFGYLVDGAIAPYGSNNLTEQQGTMNVVDNNGNFIGVPLSDYFELYPGQKATHQNIGVADTQTFNSTIDKLNLKHQFSAASFGEARLTRTSENLVSRYPYNFGSFSDHYDDLQTTGLGFGLDYTNQLSEKHEIGFGADGTYYKNRFSTIFPFFDNIAEPLLDVACLNSSNSPFGPFSGFSDNPNSPTGGWGGCYIGSLNAALNANAPGGFGSAGAFLPTDPAHAPLNRYISDSAHSDDPIHRYDVFLKDRWQPNQRTTVVVGLRFDKQVYSLPANAAQANTSYVISPDPANPNFPIVTTVPGQPIGADVTAPSQISPRLALTYQLNKSNVLRFSFGKNIEFVPLQAVESTYGIPASLRNCNIADGCFVPLPGFGTTNHISNLYQQVLLDLTTNNFAPYTPVKPQRAVNFDASLEHDFGDGNELRITPYYRKGTDYVVSSSTFLFSLPITHQPVFGPAHEYNAGTNENTGAELAFDSRREFGLSGSASVTYDNTFANYDSDFFPTVNNAAVAAGHMFHVSYVASVTATGNLVWNSRHGLHISATVPYESGYRYGVGKKVYIFQTLDNGKTLPTLVLNTDLSNPNGPGEAYYFTDPANPGTIQQPNITGSRGTPEGDDPGTLTGPGLATFNMTISQEFGAGSRPFEIGLRGENLFGNYTGALPINNPWYTNCGLGASCPGSGTNLAAATEPFQYNFGPGPYESEKNGPPRLYTLFVSWKY